MSRAGYPDHNRTVYKKGMVARVGVSTTSLALIWSSCVLAAGPAAAQSVMSRTAATTPLPPGKAGRTIAESGPPLWPRSPEAPRNAPNVLVVMTDDVGFGQSSTFGGPVPTPTFDRLAAKGLKYNQFHTTALCSPTRAALLTGRTPHHVGMGNVTNYPIGYPGYTSVITAENATIARILKDAGYNTAMFGKAHITPEWEMSQAGPFDRWPTGLGFEYYYGFLGADSSQFAPAIVENTRFVEPPYNDPSYHFDKDMADHAIRWVREQKASAPDKPFFIYYAPGTAHTPHHAPKAWLEKFRGKFDQGWDKLRAETFARQKAMGVIPAATKLTPRPDIIPAWSGQSAEQKLLASRLMEASAAALAHADYQMGRIIDELEAMGQLDNTLIIFIQGDNGPTAEGGPNGQLFEQTHLQRFSDTQAYMLSRIDEIGSPTLYNHFPSPWAWAMSSPFQWYKQVASHFGGTRNGLVISWPDQIKDQGGLRQQFHHISDILPTVLEAAHVAAPAIVGGVKQTPFDGTSMAYSFNDKAAPSTRHTQVFEMMENLGIYHDGWFAGTTPGRPAWRTEQKVPVNVGQRKWELYDVRNDFSQSTDLAKKYPDKLAALQTLFWSEADRTNILPIHGTTEGGEGRPSFANGRTSFVYRPGATRIPENAAPPLTKGSFSIVAEVEVPAEGGNGVLLAQGGRFGGYALYLKAGRPVFHYNATGPRQYTIAASQAVAPGRRNIVVDFKAEPTASDPGAGVATVLVDGTPLASGAVDRGNPRWITHTEGLDVGRDTITPVTEDYTVQTSVFNGSIDKITVNLK